jgi:hypothetical protein
MRKSINESLDIPQLPVETLLVPPRWLTNLIINFTTMATVMSDKFKPTDPRYLYTVVKVM